MKLKYISDEYSSARGGYSEFFEISCRRCGRHLCIYQKDGPGELRRMYCDRIINPSVKQRFEIDKKLACPDCGKNIGLGYKFESEQRPAYALFVGAIKKKPLSLFRHFWCILLGWVKRRKAAG